MTRVQIIQMKDAVAKIAMLQSNIDKALASTESLSS